MEGTESNVKPEVNKRVLGEMLMSGRVTGLHNFCLPLGSRHWKPRVETEFGKGGQVSRKVILGEWSKSGSSGIGEEQIVTHTVALEEIRKGLDNSLHFEGIEQFATEETVLVSYSYCNKVTGDVVAYNFLLLSGEQFEDLQRVVEEAEASESGE